VGEVSHKATLNKVVLTYKVVYRDKAGDVHVVVDYDEGAYQLTVEPLARDAEVVYQAFQEEDPVAAIREKAPVFHNTVLKAGEAFSGIWKEQDASAVKQAADVWKLLEELTQVDPTETIYGFVRHGLAQAADDEKAPDRIAHRVLGAPQLVDKAARLMLHHIQRLRAHVGMDQEPPGTEEEALRTIEIPQGEVLYWDELAAQYLEGLGEQGAQNAQQLRELAAQRLEDFSKQLTLLEGRPVPGRVWRWWIDIRHYDTARMVPVFVLLFDAIWYDQVREELRSWASNQPALALPVQEHVVNLHHKQLTLISRGDGGEILAADGSRLGVIDHAQAGLPALELRITETLLNRGIAALSTMTAHRLIRKTIVTAYEQASSGRGDYRSIVVEGGWAGFAEWIEENPKKSAGRVKDLIVLLSSIRFVLPDGTEGTLLGYHYDPPHGRSRRARLTITLMDAMLPGYVKQLRGTSARVREARRLVPVTGFPVLVNPRKTYGAQATFQTLVLAAMRRQCRDLVVYGGVLLPNEQREHLAHQAGLPQTTMERMWEANLDGDEPFLVEVEAGRFSLGPGKWRPARDFLHQAGEDEIKGQKMGQRSVQAKLLKKRAR
jgi:hypothetical protein